MTMRDFWESSFDEGSDRARRRRVFFFLSSTSIAAAAGLVVAELYFRPVVDQSMPFLGFLGFGYLCLAAAGKGDY